MSEFERQFRQFQSGVMSFADDMRSKGIHIGMGSDPHCVTCGDAWPCVASRDNDSDSTNEPCTICRDGEQGICTMHELKITRGAIRRGQDNNPNEGTNDGG